MSKAYRLRSLLFLAGVGALAGCAQLPGEAAYVRGGLDPRYVAESYASRGPDPYVMAETQVLEERWAKMLDGTEPGSVPAVSAAPAKRSVIRASVAEIPNVEPMPPAPAGKDSGATTRRSLFEKQPWEAELDKVVRGICHGC